MQNDYITFKYLKDELKEFLVGGIIDKILMPEFDEIVLGINKSYTHYNLLISANPNLARIHLTKEKKINPYTAFQFCMYLRKMFQKGVIRDIRLLNNDRIFDIEIISTNELKDSKIFHLVFENMGRFSNVFILNENNIILNALKAVPYTHHAVRSFFNGATYIPPRMLKKSIEFFESTNNYSFQTLQDNYSGFTKKTAEEIDFLLQTDKTFTTKMLSREDLLNKNLSPVIEIKDNEYTNFYIYKYNVLPENLKYITSATLSEAIEKTYSKQNKTQNITNKVKVYKQLIDKKIIKLKKGIENNKLLLSQNQNYDLNRIYGDILLSNLHKEDNLHKDKITLENIYNEMTPITIPLDSALNLKKNAEKYYRQFNKGKRQTQFLTNYNAQLTQDLEYFETIQTDISLIQNEKDIEDIKKLFISLNIIEDKNKKRKNKNQKLNIPNYQKESIDGFDFYMGKNALQNDYVTFKIGSSNDIWLHVKNYHGAHGIIVTQGKSVDIKVIEKCAKIIAQNSKCKNESKIDVDYTQRKNVKKSGNKLGLVHYTNYRTVTVKI